MPCLAPGPGRRRDDEGKHLTDTVTIPDLDRAIGFTIPERHARGRVVRLKAGAACTT